MTITKGAYNVRIKKHKERLQNLHGNSHALKGISIKFREMDQAEIEEKMNKIENGEEIEETEEQISYNYDDFLNLTFKILLNSDYYAKENGAWVDKSDNKDYVKEKVDNAEEIKVVGIVKQNECLCRK